MWCSLTCSFPYRLITMSVEQLSLMNHPRQNSASSLLKRRTSQSPGIPSMTFICYLPSNKPLIFCFPQDLPSVFVHQRLQNRAVSYDTFPSYPTTMRRVMKDGWSQCALLSQPKMRHGSPTHSFASTAQCATATQSLE